MTTSPRLRIRHRLVSLSRGWVSPANRALTEIPASALDPGDLVSSYSNLAEGVYVADGHVVLADEASGRVWTMRLRPSGPATSVGGSA